MYSDPGRALGKYRLIAEIARGGMGIVYLAMVQGPGGFNKLVVVKELKPELVEEAAFLQMFLDEAKLAARLNHPNIVQTNEVGNEGDRYFMAMDYLDGRGLDRVRRRARTAGWGLSMPMSLRVTCDMLAGLDYAHKLTDFDGSPLSIVHRDISPQNVFVTFDGQVKLLDFGIAKTVESTNETKAGVLKGKISYMAPEHARGQKVDARSDVFSAGVMLWEALTGRKLHQGQSEQAILAALIAGDLPRASTVKPWVPTELDEICARAMAVDAGERYQSATDFQDAIERYLTASGTNVSARDVGACISELFREDRASINTLIESHIARARNESARDDLPVIELSYEPHAGTLNTPLPSRPETIESSGSSNVIVSAAPSAQSATPPAPPRKKPVLAIVLAVAALGAGAAIYLTRGHDEPAVIARTEEPPPPRVAVPQPRPVEPPVIDPKPASVDVDIRVTPPNASVTIDGVNLPANPFHGKYLSDQTTHEVRVAAPGFHPKIAAITFNANVTLDVSLERVPVAVSRSAVVQPRVTAPPRPADPAPPTVPEAKPAKGSNDINPEGGIKPRRPIDSTNPYGAK
jgi:eukaryotic-like serine/threonine-protein kinase